MEIVKNEYCNECKSYTHLIVTSFNSDSIFAKCPLCSAEFDLIYDEGRISQLVEHKEIIYTAVNDPDFGESKQKVVILAGNILIDLSGDSWVFRVVHKSFTNYIDLDDCSRFELIDFDASVDFEWLANASFLEVVRRFAK